MNNSLPEHLTAFVRELDSIAQVGSTSKKLPSKEFLEDRVSELIRYGNHFSAEEMMKIAQNLTAYEERLIANYSHLPQGVREQKVKKINALFDNYIGAVGEIVKAKEGGKREGAPHLLNLMIVMSQRGSDNGSMESKTSTSIKENITTLVSKNFIASWNSKDPNWLKSKEKELESYQIYWQKESGFILLVSQRDKNLNLKDLGFNAEDFEALSFSSLEERLKDKTPKDFPCRYQDLQSSFRPSQNVQRNVFLMGHGNKTAVANLKRPDYQNFLGFLEHENTLCLTVLSCFVGEGHKAYIQRYENSSKKMGFPVAIFGLGGTISTVQGENYQKYFDSLNHFFLSPGPKTNRSITPILKSYQDVLPAHSKIIVSFPARYAGKIGFRAVSPNVSELSLIEIRKAMSRPTHTIDIPQDANQILCYLQENPVSLNISSSEPPQLISMIGGPSFHYIDSITTPRSTLMRFGTHSLLAHKEDVIQRRGMVSEVTTSKAYLIREVKTKEGTFKHVMLVGLHPNRTTSDTRLLYITGDSDKTKTYHQDTYDLNLKLTGLPEEKFWTKEIISPLEFAAQWVAIQHDLKPNEESVGEAALEQQKEGKWEQPMAESFWENAKPSCLNFVQKIFNKEEMDRAELEKAADQFSGRELSYLLELGKKGDQAFKEEVPDLVQKRLQGLNENEKWEFHYHRFKQRDSSYLNALLDEEKLSEKSNILLMKVAIDQVNLEIINKLLPQISLEKLDDDSLVQLYKLNQISAKDINNVKPDLYSRILEEALENKNEEKITQLLNDIDLQTFSDQLFGMLIGNKWEGDIPSTLIQEASSRLEKQGKFTRDRFTEDEGEQLQFILKSFRQGDEGLWRQFLEKKSVALREENLTSVQQFLKASQNFYLTLSPFSDVYEELAKPWREHVSSLKRTAKPFYTQLEKDRPPLDHYQKFLNSFNPVFCVLYSEIKQKGDPQQLAFIEQYLLRDHLPDQLK